MLNVCFQGDLRRFPSNRHRSVDHERSTLLRGADVNESRHRRGHVMSDQSDSLRHSEVEHTVHLSECIGSLLTSSDHSDITLVVEGEHLHAHRVILASRCEYFRYVEGGSVDFKGRTFVTNVTDLVLSYQNM